MNNAWFERTVSSFPLSIGTGLALESLFKPTQPPYDPEREVPPHIPLSSYNVFYVNIRTLLRNIYGAVPKEVFMQAKAQDVVMVLESEISVIQDLMRNEAQDTVKPLFYHSPFEKISKIETNQFIKLRVPTTDLQKYTVDLTDKIINLFFKRNTDDRFIRTFRNDIRPQGSPKALMLTHFPYDLTSSSYFRTLDLLESHTGKKKNRSTWFTKFYGLGDHDLSYIPMVRKMLFVFGDHVSFSPWSSKARLQVYDIAKKYDWTYSTTDERICLTLKLGLADQFMADTICGFPS